MACHIRQGPAETGGQGASLAQPRTHEPLQDVADSRCGPALQAGLHAIVDTWAGGIRRQVRRLAIGDQAAQAGAADLIHDLRGFVGRFCALSELLPQRGRPRSARRALRKEVAWAMQPLTRARDWAIFAGEILPRLFDAEPDLDRELTAKRAAARSAVVHGEMCVHLRSERFQGLLQQFQQRDVQMHAAMADTSAKQLYRRIRRKLDRWDERVRDRLAGKAVRRDARVQRRVRNQVERLRAASEALIQLCAFRKRERYAQSLEALHAALQALQDLRMAARLGPVVCVSLSSGRLTDPASGKACRRMLRKADEALRAARSGFLRHPSLWADQGWAKFSRRQMREASRAQGNNLSIRKGGDAS
ncbi:hypothetical protein A7J67_09175 [Achromobacter xylosoxidans]|nr:hypothetical protein A7J67_09175 [Achromobacter xylosoxidans]